MLPLQAVCKATGNRKTTWKIHLMPSDLKHIRKLYLRNTNTQCQDPAQLNMPNRYSKKMTVHGGETIKKIFLSKSCIPSLASLFKRVLREFLKNSNDYPEPIYRNKHKYLQMHTFLPSQLHEFFFYKVGSFNFHFVHFTFFKFPCCLFFNLFF